MQPPETLETAPYPCFCKIHAAVFINDTFAIHIAERIRKARANGCPLIVVPGQPAYYRRLGFEPGSAYGIQSPYPAGYFMVLFLHQKPAYLPGTA